MLFFVPASLISLVPNPDDLLALEVEEIAWVLFAHLNSYDDNSGDGVVSQGLISQYNFFNNLSQHPVYPHRQEEVNKVLAEGWNWLEREGFFVRRPETTPSWFFFSRRAKALKSRGDFDAYRRANLLPRAQLHPSVAAKVYPAFLRGDYDTAVFQAFREVEVAVRGAGGFPPELVGTKLMREGFRPSDLEKPTASPGPLTDTTLPIAEQKGMADLFSGTIALFKNPSSHRIMNPEAVEAAEVIVFASHLLRMVDRLCGDSA